MQEEFVSALRSNQKAFGIDLPDGAIARLVEYYELVLEHNPRLHLVAPCSPSEFATRHTLESLTVLRHLPIGASFVDVGSGGGLPAIPCLVVRPDLRARLIESKEKKSAFLSRALERLGASSRSDVIARQFAETEPGDAGYLTVRALDKFSAHLPKLLKWAQERQILFFGGEMIGERLTSLGVLHTDELMPLSEKRYLFVGSLDGAAETSATDKGPR